MKLKEFTGGGISLLVLAVEEKLTKNGKTYLALALTDGEKEISANKWDSDLASTNIQKGQVCDCTLDVGEYNGQPNYTIKDMTVNTTANVSDYVPSAPISATTMYAEIVNVVKGFQNADLLRITGNIIQDNRIKLMTWGAAKAVHHNVVTGLLYHMYRMMKSAIALAEIYPVNKELLIAGVLLHDIGKTAELETDELGNSTYTVDGNLYGHLYIGAEMIHDYGLKFNTDPELVRNLKHIILSHHGKLEWDAVKPPCTIEASLIAELDMIDARMYQFEKFSSELEPGTIMEKNVYTLDNAHVYLSTLN